MSDVCSTCGLPKDICACETIAKESQRVKVYAIKKKFGKLSTVIEGIDSKDIDLKDIAKKLKANFACGGTVKDNKIELQGDHRTRIKGKLALLGFAQETIDIK